MKFILLDFDGVMIPAKNWKPVPMLRDGFLEFSLKATQQLDRMLMETGAIIVLTTTHRRALDTARWKNVFKSRLEHFTDLAIIDEYINAESLESRLSMVVKWAADYSHSNFVVIDDDTALDDLPLWIKKHWVKTKPMIGLNEEDATRALQILLE